MVQISYAVLHKLYISKCTKLDFFFLDLRFALNKYVISKPYYQMSEIYIQYLC